MPDLRHLDLYDFEVRGLLAGSVTQIRRSEGLECVNAYPGLLTGVGAMGARGYRGLLPSDYYLAPSSHDAYRENPAEFHWFYGEHKGQINPIPVRCPYGAPGTEVACREAFYADARDTSASTNPAVIYVATPEWFCAKMDGVRRCSFPDGAYVSREESERNLTGHRFQRLRAADALPDWAVRLRLVASDIRAERLGDITTTDAYACGATDSWPLSGLPCLSGHGGRAVVNNYLHLWKSTASRQQTRNWEAQWQWVFSGVRLAKKGTVPCG